MYYYWCNWDTSSLMNPWSWGVSGLRSSYTLMWATQLRVINPRLVSEQHYTMSLPVRFTTTWRLADGPGGFFSCNPLIPWSLSALCRDCPGKPLQPTSTGSHWAFQPNSLQASTSSRYLVFFGSLASHIRSSHGTVSSCSCGDQCQHQVWPHSASFPSALAAPSLRQ